MQYEIDSRFTYDSNENRNENFVDEINNINIYKLFLTKNIKIN